MSKKICFIVSPIGEEGSDIRKNADTVLKHIVTPSIDTDKFDVIRVDTLPLIDKIDQTIIEYLKTADLVIADMTGHNPNVFYEFGYRQALGLPLIPIIEEKETLPFDVTTLRTIKYSTTDLDKVAETKQRLKDTINAINFDRNSNNVKSNNNEQTGFLSINNKLDTIIDLITQNNTDMINTVAEQVAKHTRTEQTTEERLLVAILPELIKNPEALNVITNLSQNP